MSGTYYWEASYGGIWLQTPYRPAWLEEIKEKVPYRQRHWDAGARLWWVGTQFVDMAYAITLHHFGRCAPRGWGDRREPEAPSRAKGAGAGVAVPAKRSEFEVLHLQPSAPVEVVKGAYKALCPLHHPDCGGDAQKMAQVNDAYASLRARLAF